ncbi:Alpha/Beta hydrolase protein [Penicillium canariense]|uniref:Alpha/Beta hydrolase protein n=1 Tax=Penicillium canariense TaxID=189055 RepID=A0A9W9LG84_9EURO|nr:Alpha/Beta hydrolase protein [Penicillium canariense]KAJ5152915.1 Alpha/Beta hydrolase protein [Penicillium canariense]
MSGSKDEPTGEPGKEGLGDILFDPKEKAKVDIIFVHGLGGNRIDTCKQYGRTQNPRVAKEEFELWHLPNYMSHQLCEYIGTWKNEDRSQFWPKTLLPTDCPTARIMSFGYNSDFAHFFPMIGPKGISPDLTIDNYSASLFDALIGLRKKTNTAERPIIFVAHSLGGLVVANALSRPHGTDDAAKELADQTIGTLFLGTPFHGSSKAKYGSLAVSFLSYFMAAAKQNIEDLKERSAKLASINDAFAKFLKQRDRSRTKPFLEVACFFEDESLYKKGVKIGKIVPKESASWLGVDALSISKDHIAMCKFSDEDSSDYKSVSGKLAQWVADIDKNQDLSSGRVKGLNAQVCHHSSPPILGGLTDVREQGIVVNQGNVDNRGITNHGVVTGNNYGTSKDAIKITGTIVSTALSREEVDTDSMKNYNGVKPVVEPE